MLAETFADQIQSTGQGGIAETAASSRGKTPGRVAVSDFSGLLSSAWALASALARAPMVLLQLCMADFLLQNLKADRSGFRALGPNAMAGCLFGVFRHQLF